MSSIFDYKDYGAMEAAFAGATSNVSDTLGYNFDPNDISAPLDDLLHFVGY